MPKIVVRHRKKFFVSGTIIVVFVVAINTVTLNELTGTTTLKFIPTNERPLIESVTTAEIVVEAKEPINALEAEMTFSPDYIEILDVTFDQSFIDLWVFEPVFSNASGTLSFTGGTIRRGGFIGPGTIATITYRGTQPGRATIGFTNVRVLASDGLGSDVVSEGIDAELIVESLQQVEAVSQSNGSSAVVVVQNTEPPSPDLNSDGKISISDVSIFATHLTGDYVYQSDFNQDGEVNLKDASIILSRSLWE